MSGWVAGAIVGGAVIGAVGSNMAANKQAGAAQNAANAQERMFNQTVANEQPFMEAGKGAQGQLNYLLGIGKPGEGGTASGAGSAGGFGSLNAPFTVDTFHKMSPAYQFQLQQGGQGVLNQSASGQGAMSGSALKDLMSFNQNFANTSFNNAFNQYQTQQSNVFGRLANIAGLGQAAASNQATGASTFGGNIGQQLYNVGSAQAGGVVGATNSLGSLSALPWLMNAPAGSTPTNTGTQNIYNPNSGGWTLGGEGAPVGVNPWGP